MDYSQGSTLVGSTDLTQPIVDAYFASMPTALGFINGYSPSFTFAESQDGRPLLSFDYYLDPDVTLQQAVADLQQLATVNTVRPYFLLMHVREVT
jgi:hypothetical protein